MIHLSCSLHENVSSPQKKTSNKLNWEHVIVTAKYKQQPAILVDGIAINKLKSYVNINI